MRNPYRTSAISWQTHNVNDRNCFFSESYVPLVLFHHDAHLSKTSGMFSVTSEMSEKRKVGQNQEGPRERTQRQFSKLSTPDFLQTTKLKTLHRVRKLWRIAMACFKNPNSICMLLLIVRIWIQVYAENVALYSNASCCDTRALVAVSLRNLFAFAFIVCDTVAFSELRFSSYTFCMWEYGFIIACFCIYTRLSVYGLQLQSLSLRGC